MEKFDIRLNGKSIVLIIDKMKIEKGKTSNGYAKEFIFEK